MAYSKEQKTKKFDDVCSCIISGMSLRKALIKVKLNDQAFFEWIRKDESKSLQYARATDQRAWLMFEDMLDIADESPERMDTKNGTCIDSGHIQDKRVRIDTRKWALSKMMPKKYGDKPQDASDNSDNEIIIKVVE